MLGLAFGVSSVERSGLTLSGALHTAIKGGAWRRRMGQQLPGGINRRTMSNLNPVVALNSALRFTPLEIMPRSVSSPAIAGLEFLTG